MSVHDSPGEQRSKKKSAETLVTVSWTTSLGTVLGREADIPHSICSPSFRISVVVLIRNSEAAGCKTARCHSIRNCLLRDADAAQHMPTRQNGNGTCSGALRKLR